MTENASTALVGHIEEAGGRPLTDEDITLDRQERCASAVVQQLFERTGLARLLDPKTLNVVVGQGNWISFSFEMQRGADHTSLDSSHALRRASRKPEPGRPLVSSWFRSLGKPSLHFEVIPAARLGESRVQGHVDAADPKRHPVAHFLTDYLPAHGIGKHPTPECLLAQLTSLARPAR